MSDMFSGTAFSDFIVGRCVIFSHCIKFMFFVKSVLFVINE